MRALLFIISILFVAPAFADEEFETFIQKIRDDDVEWVEKFLGEKAELGQSYTKLNTEDPGFLCRPLFLARSPEMVRALQAAGAKMPKKKGIACEYIEAINADNVNLVREILDTGNVDVNYMGLQRRRAVMMAYSPEMVMLLIERGALLCNFRRSKQVYEQQSFFERAHDALPYTDDHGNNALHVLAETATRLLRRLPADDNIRRRVEATALFLIRQDLDGGQQNPGRAILTMLNADRRNPRALFRGPFWGEYFLERLGPAIEARPRPVMPVLNLNLDAVPRALTLVRPQIILAPAAVGPRREESGIERESSPNIFGDSDL